MIKLRLRLRVATTKISKLRVVAGAEGFLVAELRVRQLKIGSKSCFGIYGWNKGMSWVGMSFRDPVIYPVRWESFTYHYHLISSQFGATHPTAIQSCGQLNYCAVLWLAKLPRARQRWNQTIRTLVKGFKTSVLQLITLIWSITKPTWEYLVQCRLHTELEEFLIDRARTYL